MIPDPTKTRPTILQGMADAFVVSEPTAWLRAATARRMRELRQIAAVTDAHVIAFLSSRPSRPGDREDRTCDRCRVYVEPDALFCCAVYTRGRISLGLGLCAGCAAKESPEWASSAGVS